jgi:hypothetical protein
MKMNHIKLGLLTALFTLTASAQSVTFDFANGGSTSGAGNSQTWSQTVDGITCTASFNTDTAEEGYIDAGAPDLINNNGLYTGFIEATADERLSYFEHGFSLTFSQDVRLKAVNFGQVEEPAANIYLSLAGGNVSALISAHNISANTDYPFELEALVPANTPIQSFTSYNISEQYRLASITVERETYVAPVIEPPEGSETGISRIAVMDGSTITDELAFALKNGELHAWGHAKSYSQERLFPGVESGVIDFVLDDDGNDVYILAKTAEGCAWFDLSGIEGVPQLRPLPADFPTAPDRMAIGKNFVLALKDGQLYTGGAIAAPPAELQNGGITDIAGANVIAFALQDGNVIAWGEVPPGNLAGANLNVPAELTSGGRVDAIFGNDGVCAALVGDRIVAWGFGSGATHINNDPRLQSGVTDLLLSNDKYCAIKDDGSLAIHEDFQEGETPPVVVQQLGFTQLAFSSTRVAALLPSGRMLIWGDNYVYNKNSTIFGISAHVVPVEVNSILYPQTAARLPENPTAAELSMLQDGGLGIQWGSNTPYEVQTTTDILGNDWQPLPTDDNERFYRIDPITP